MRLPSETIHKPWGRTDLSDAFAVDMRARIGEIWFDDPRRDLPLLVKWLFTSENLSLQVHPDNATARRHRAASGKDEAWYIVEAEKGAKVGIGLREPMSRATMLEAITDGSLTDRLRWHAASPGDCFFIPAGTVHSIGAGISLIEIQQNADITYRLYDFGRGRRLDIDKGLDAANLSTDAGEYRCSYDRLPGETKLIDSVHFEVSLVSGTFHADVRSARSPVWITPIRGSTRVNDVDVQVGECAYEAEEAVVQTAGSTEVLIARAKQV